jgi:hypothetical protein
MTEFFKVLSDSEIDQLKDAISLITIYIAGADGKIHEDETNWAKKVAKIRSYSLPGSLKEFYLEVGVDFQDRIDNYTKSLSDLETRNKTVAEKLTALNPILAKLPPKLGATIYNSYVSFAKHVAKASGGFFGFFAIGPAEAALLDLEMITPIVWVEEEESEEEA